MRHRPPVDNDLMPRERAGELDPYGALEGIVIALPAHGASADDRELRRGLPMIGPGVGGTIRGTQPEAALLAKERRRERQP
jgi:hypothetical protein